VRAVVEEEADFGGERRITITRHADTDLVGLIVGTVVDMPESA
jgi:hypothetical protein